MPTVYKSTDASAPVLSGQVNALVNVLDKCLVAGYGSQTAAGWTKPYTGTNAAVFLQGGSGVLKYFQIDDNGPGAGAACEARVWGFETMTAYNTGTGQFPAAATAAAVRKSNTADATARDWIVVADAKTCHVWTFAGDVANQWQGHSFGDLYSYRVGDLWKGYVCCRSVENVTVTTNEALTSYQSNILTATSQGAFYGQRSYTGFGTFVNLSNCGGNGFLAALTPGVVGVVANRGGVTFPNAADGKLLTTPMRINQGLTVIRGRHRGIYCGAHPTASFNDQDIFSGVNEYSGKTFLIIKFAGSVGGVQGYFIVETSTWDESS
jgi:hypothetical protein